MSRCGSKSTLKGREHTLSCSGDTSKCYNCNHMIIPDRVSPLFLSAASELFTR
ncbi:hypothetical protein K439DRAFT_1642013, partial [Ramaria rubella]